MADEQQPDRAAATDVLSWNDRTVPRMAQAIYDEVPHDCPTCKGLIPDYDCPTCHADPVLPGTGILNAGKLAILADALEDAGCTRDELLNHLRGMKRCPKCLGETFAKHYHFAHARPEIERCECDTGWLHSDAPHVRDCWAVELCKREEPPRG